MSDSETTRRRRRKQSLGKGPVLGSAIIHTMAILLTLWVTATPSDLPEYITFEIELISPPAAELGEIVTVATEELVIETPFDPVPELPEEPPPTVVGADAPVAEIPPPPEVRPDPEENVSTPDVELVDDAEPPASQDPDPNVETPGEDLNVRMAGIRRDYPVYYKNIIRQMERCFRPPVTDEDLRAAIYFVINRDGSTSDPDIRESSGSIGFDIAAIGAAECAGRPAGFGPLPEELPYDRFPVVFTFDPQSRQTPDVEQ
ncbi:MAG TPA: hypothetical protein EYQ64_12005 [Gemmatimonadetes bacterium]|nr:hypothetical protein [Gemmatimonadota bacterium]